MERDAPDTRNNAVSARAERADNYLDHSNLASIPTSRHRRHASNVSPGAAFRIRPQEVTPRPRVVRETSPHSSASAPSAQGTTQFSLADARMSRIPSIAKTFSSPNLQPIQVDAEERPFSSPGAQPPSTPLLRAHTTPSIPRLSPSQKRKPPASHSSYGIETSNGPPPSYSTQLTLSQERAWPQERGRSQKPVNTTSITPDDIESTKYSQSQITVLEPRKSEPLPQSVTIRRENAAAFTTSTSASPHSSSHISQDLARNGHDVDESSPVSLSQPELQTRSTSFVLKTPPFEQGSAPTSTDAEDRSTIETSKSSELTPPTSASTHDMQDDYGLENTVKDYKSYGTQQRSDEDNMQHVDPAKRPHPDYARRAFDNSVANESSSTDSASGTDLFLKIARDSTTARHDASAKQSNNNSSRRSRISLPFLTSSRPSTSLKTSPVSTRMDSETSRPAQRPSKRASLGPHVPSALTPSTYPSEVQSHVGIPLEHVSSVDQSETRSQIRSRRHSNANPETSRPPTRSYQRSRLASENLFAEKFRMQEQTKTESTISTTAPSTVWDELDDLKSRIRKLELTGKLPPSSAAAMTGSNERPRTATTQATTLSSSPKHKSTAPANNLPSAIEGIPSNVHPTLHDALTKAKASVPNDIYQKLQATAQDALQLSTMLNSDYSGMSTVTPQTERQIRRRTESMCRSLTELTIAILAEQQHTNSPTSRPASRDAFAGSQLRSRRRSDSIEQQQPVMASRIVSRRTSAVNSAEPSPRPVSRAMTEAPSAYRQPTSSRANFSREYTRQHPLPITEPQSATTPHGTFFSRRPVAIASSPAATPPAVESSPVPFTISIERSTPSALPRHSTFPESPGSVVSEASPAGRAGSVRRPMGFAARVSSVSSRLKAVREQRLNNAAAAAGRGQGDGASVVSGTTRTVMIPPVGSSGDRHGA